MILILGNDCDSILTLQKKALRVVYSKHPKSHCDPLFIASKSLKVHDLHSLAQLKFGYKYVNGTLPHYSLNIPFPTNDDHHNYETRSNNQLRSRQPVTERGRRCIRSSLPHLINSLPESIKIPLYNNSYNEMVWRFKNHALEKYSCPCTVSNCYSCSVSS